MSSTEHTTLIVENINNHANDILLKGGGDEELLRSLDDIMNEMKKVMDASTHQQLANTVRNIMVFTDMRVY